jgi:short-subunit dehydrogenase
MRIDLKDKRVLLTGASSGIGRALAKELARAGAKLAVSARRVPSLESLADEIVREGGARPVVLPADLSVRGEATRLADRGSIELGPIDVLVNNAGVSVGGAQAIVGDGDIARAMFETNYWAPLALVQALVPGMKKRGFGVVVNVSSVGSVLSMPLAGHYSSSKAALALATETLRMELRKSGVHVLHVLPGPVDTGMLSEASLVPGGEKLIRTMPRGDVDTLAKKTRRALERGRMTLVYPGVLSIVRHLPTLAGVANRAAARVVDVSDERAVMGGSQGAEIVRAARESAEQRLGGKTPPSPPN